MALYHLQVAKLTCISQPNRNDMNGIILNVYIAFILGCPLYLTCIRFL